MSQRSQWVGEVIRIERDMKGESDEKHFAKEAEENSILRDAAIHLSSFPSSIQKALSVFRFTAKHTAKSHRTRA